MKPIVTRRLKFMGWSAALACALLLCFVARSDASLGVDAYWGSPEGQGGTGLPGGWFHSSGPYGVAVDDASGNVYVADSGNNRIQQFTADGGFIRAWGFDVDGSNPSTGFEICADKADCKGGVSSVSPAPGGELSDPRGIAVNQVTGHLYVNDRAFNRIQEFDPEGNFLRAFGQDVVSAGPGNAGTGYEICSAANGDTCKAGSSTGAAAGVISSPVSSSAYLAVAPAGAPNAGDLLVPDPNRNRVQEFSAAGAFVRTFGGGVVNGGAAGTGNVTAGSTQVTGVTTTAKFFVAGQPIAGGGIPAGARIASVANGGVINLTQAATETNAATPLAAAPGAGNVAGNETQRISLPEGVAGGNFKLSFTTPAPNNTTAAANTTANIPFDATAEAVQSALGAVGNIGSGNVTVTGPAGGPWVVEFVGRYADTNVNLLGQAAGTPPLSTGTVGRTVLGEGAGAFEVCTSALECQAGVPGKDPGEFAEGEVARVAEDPNGNLYTVETKEGGTPALQKVQKFTLPGNLPTPAGDFACSVLCGEDASSKTRNNPTNVAVDGQGFVYVVKAVRVGEGDPPVIRTREAEWQDRVLKLAPSGALVESINANTGGEPGVEGDASFSNEIQGISGVAVTTPGSRLYLATAFVPLGTQGRSRIYRFTEISGLEASASTGAVGATAATLEGTVSPAETLNHVKTLYSFEYRRVGTTGWIRVPDDDVNVGNGSAGGESSACSAQVEAATCQVSQEIDGLELGRTYQYRLVARTSYRGAVLTTEPQEFTTTAAPPSVTTGGAVWSGPPSTNPSLTFNGTVNPQGANTRYAFQYVSESDFEASGFADAQTAPPAPISAGHGTKTLAVTAAKAALDASQGYRFRLVAANFAGTAAGATGSVAASKAGNRFVELVSLGDSQGGDVSNAVTVSDDGERAAFTSITFGDDQQAAPWIVNPAIARRGSGGWKAVAMGGDPDSSVGATNLIGGVGNAEVTERLWGTRPLPETVRWEVRGLDGELTPISPLLSPLDRSGSFRLEFLGGSNDLSTLVLANETTSSTLFPNELLLPGGASNLYEVSGAGTGSPSVSLLNRAEGGGTIGGVCGAALGSGTGVRAGAVSADGSIVYFSARAGTATSGNCEATGTGLTNETNVVNIFAGSFTVGQAITGTNIPPGAVIEAVGSGTITLSKPTTGSGLALNLKAGFPIRIFKRDGDAGPVEPSACAKPSPATCSGGDDQYLGASADGSKVFFSTSRQLTDSDVDSTEDLYLYDSTPPAGQPKTVQVSAGELVPGPNPGDPAAHEVGNGADVLGVVDFAMNGSRVYFVAKGRLTPEGSAGANNLYVFQRDAAHADGRVAFVATLAPGAYTGGVETDPRLWAADSNSGGHGKPAYALPRYAEEGGIRSDGDGHLLVFVSSQPLSADDGDSVNDLYRFDDETGQMVCLSCAGDEAEPVSIIGRDISKVDPDQIQQERAASEDGSKVAFVTKEALLSADANVAEDVYLWEDGALNLISGATAEVGTSYSEARGGPAVSPDGGTVFFATRATLLPQDLDNGARDIYAARVDGGFRQAETSVPCADEEACRGPQPSTPPSLPAPGTVNPPGTGNVKFQCAKKRVLRKGRCVKPKHRRTKKHRAHKQKPGKGKKQSRTNSGRRAGR